MGRNREKLFVHETACESSSDDHESGLELNYLSNTSLSYVTILALPKELVVRLGSMWDGDGATARDSPGLRKYFKAHITRCFASDSDLVTRRGNWKDSHAQTQT